MALVLTIGGVAKEVRAGSLNISATANGRTTASFQIDSTAGTYRPAIDAEVLITWAGVRIFGGLVERPTERGLAAGARPGIATTVSAVDFNQYAERRIIIDGGFPAGFTLLQALTSLVGNLAVYGVTLDAGQVTGPTLPELIYKGPTISTILNELATLTGKYGEPFAWRINEFKVLSMTQPSTVAAPFDILTNTPSQVVGDITVELTREHYANRIFVVVPDKTEYNRVETFTGDGSTTVFTTQYTPFNQRGRMLVDGESQSLGDDILTPIGPGTQWILDRGSQTLTAATAPADGATIEFPFDGKFAGTATASDAGEIAAHGPYERLVRVDEVPSDTTTQAIADAYLAQSLTLTQKITYVTHTDGLRPGMTQTITVPRRNVNVSAVITDIVTREVGKDKLARQVTAVEDGGNAGVGKGWRDVIKIWSDDHAGGKITAGAPVSIGTGPPSSGGPAPPNKAVQFNRNGLFGGDEAFTYDETKNTLTCGALSTIENASDSQAFGHDCHIR